MAGNIFRVNKNLPRQNQIDEINEMALELEGRIAQGKFDINEIDHIYEILNTTRQYERNAPLGNTLATYTSWSHLRDETGYSIWKFTPTNYLFSEVNQLYFDDKIVVNKGEALSENVTAFDNVFLFDAEAASGGPQFEDNTTEAGTEGGTEFEVMDSTDDYLYIGLDETFAGAAFEWETRGSLYSLTVEYYNAGSGDGFTALGDDDNLTDNTSNFESNGVISWDIPTDWMTTTINGQNRYWIRISTSDANLVTVAKAFSIVPANNVPGVLTLSSTEVLEEAWAWCSFNSSIYVTIRNTAAPNFEGDLFVTASSSDQNLQNYFVFNHEYTLDHSKVVVTEASFVTRETPTGDIDEVNTTYTLANIPGLGTERVYLNGMLQNEGALNDYTISGKIITFNDPPESGSKILVSYLLVVSDSFVTRQTPSGVINSINTVFVLADTPLIGTEEVFLNGQLKTSGAGNDYTISGDTVTFIIPPQTGDTLLINYRK